MLVASSFLPDQPWAQIFSRRRCIPTTILEKIIVVTFTSVKRLIHDWACHGLVTYWTGIINIETIVWPMVAFILSRPSGGILRKVHTSSLVLWTVLRRSEQYWSQEIGVMNGSQESSTRRCGQNEASIKLENISTLVPVSLNLIKFNEGNVFSVNLKLDKFQFFFFFMFKESSS